jgi:hemerythrin-like domain-containing protein
MADFDRIEHEETGESIHEKYLRIADELAEVVT